jgi:hypothetical protein
MSEVVLKTPERLFDTLGTLVSAHPETVSLREA